MGARQHRGVRRRSPATSRFSASPVVAAKVTCLLAHAIGAGPVPQRVRDERRAASRHARPRPARGRHRRGARAPRASVPTSRRSASSTPTRSCRQPLATSGRWASRRRAPASGRPSAPASRSIPSTRCASRIGERRQRGARVHHPRDGRVHGIAENSSQPTKQPCAMMLAGMLGDNADVRVRRVSRREPRRIAGVALPADRVGPVHARPPHPLRRSAARRRRDRTRACTCSTLRQPGPDGVERAGHGSDMPFFFDNLDKAPASDGPHAAPLVRTMSGALVALGPLGRSEPRPNSQPGLGTPNPTEQRWCSTSKPRVENDPMAAERRAWNAQAASARRPSRWRMLFTRS